jgi:formylglycine-generating enzyme required for sulfatase activity
VFDRGSPDREEGRRESEGPVREVRLSSFFLGRYAVTNAEYDLFLKKNPGLQAPECWGDRRFNGARQPVVGVSWLEAQAYCDWAGLVLPSEAQWEYACRAAKPGAPATRYWSGNGEADLARVGWYAGNSDGKLHPVGEKPANAFGLFDMHGNVWEWCEDAWHENYEGAPDDGTAWVAGGDQDARVLRGGGFGLVARGARSACRRRDRPSLRGPDVGFRPARVITE